MVGPGTNTALPQCLNSLDWRTSSTSQSVAQRAREWAVSLPAL